MMPTPKNAAIALKHVTITGADDSTSIAHMQELSERYPFVEWGVLVSLRQESSPRFPGRNWIDRLMAVAGSANVNLSTHVCGRWVREMLVGDLDWEELPSCIQTCQRIQINTHAERHVSTLAMMAKLYEKRQKQFIFQWDGINNHLTTAASCYGINVAALFDTSGGAGVVPASWPNPARDFPCGFAGGLGPDNVVEQLGKIAAVCPRNYETWIDMERRVRTEDDSSLDMAKVERVLSLVADYKSANA